MKAIAELPPGQWPAENGESKLVAAIVDYRAAYLRARGAQIPADPARLSEAKHFPNIVEVMLGRLDLSKLGGRDPSAWRVKDSGARPARVFNDGIGAQPKTQEE